MGYFEIKVFHFTFYCEYAIIKGIRKKKFFIKLLISNDGGSPLKNMGFNTRTKGKFFTIYSGKICIRVQEGTEGSISRVNKLGNTIHEVFFDSFTGILKNIKIKENATYGNSWEFVFEDEGENCILQLSYSNSYATALLKMLPNIDVAQKFTLSPSQKIVEGKVQSSLFVNQNDTPIKHAYTKGAPNGLPDLEKIMVKGKETWDDSKRLAFLTDMVNEVIIPKLGKDPIGTEVDQEPKSFDQQVEDLNQVEEEDDF